MCNAFSDLSRVFTGSRYKGLILRHNSRLFCSRPEKQSSMNPVKLHTCVRGYCFASYGLQFLDIIQDFPFYCDSKKIYMFVYDLRSEKGNHTMVCNINSKSVINTQVKLLYMTLCKCVDFMKQLYLAIEPSFSLCVTARLYVLSMNVSIVESSLVVHGVGRALISTYSCVCFKYT